LQAGLGRFRFLVAGGEEVLEGERLEEPRAAVWPP